MLFDRKESRAKPKGLNIIIIGCGKVGAALTEMLDGAGYNVTLIDKDPARIEPLTDKYDVMGIVGNGATYSVQEEAGIEDADLVIAVTDMDELNLLCCTVAKRTGKCSAIARVRQPEYSNEVAYIKDKLELAMVINPEKLVAREIARRLSLPEAMDINSFAHAHAEMIRFKIPEGCVLDGLKLANLQHSVDANVLVAVVERGDSIVIPNGDYILHGGDVISFVSNQKNARHFFYKIGYRSFPVRKAMIIGGGRTSFYLAKRLVDNGISCEIIERSKEVCEELSDSLPGVSICCGDGSDEELLREEGIGSVDAFVPLTGMEEQNILLTLQAAEMSDAKVITKIKRNTFKNVISKLNLGSVVYPQYITAEAIAGYVRGLSSSQEFDNIETLYHLFDSRVEAIEFNVRAKSEVTGVPLRNLRTRDNLLIAGIIRHARIIIPRGDDTIEVGDNVIIVTTNKGLTSLDDILDRSLTL